jgi:hypothetical protein
MNVRARPHACSKRPANQQAAIGLDDEALLRAHVRGRQLPVVAGARNHLDLLLTGQSISGLTGNAVQNLSLRGPLRSSQ